MYYLVERNYVGPNPYDTQFVDADELYITTVPARTNSSKEIRTEGWCGTTNDWAVYAHGEYETIEKAREAIAEKFGETRIQEQGEYDEPENVFERYKFGKYIPMSREETADWAHDGIQADITADTTDEKIESLVCLYQADAHAQGFELDSDLDDLMRKHRQKLRDERAQAEDEQ
jgi:hypothetical protein